MSFDKKDFAIKSRRKTSPCFRILTVMKTFAKERESNFHQSSFVEELDKRIEELDSGKVKGSKWKEIKQTAKQSMSK